MLSELRDRLRAGDVWVSGSRQYQSFEERLICWHTQNACGVMRNGRAGMRVNAERTRTPHGLAPSCGARTPKLHETVRTPAGRSDAFEAAGAAGELTGG